jgi:type III pantothenate kinase
MRTASEDAAAEDALVVSIFVNPMQFSPTEDLARYPRSLDTDLEICAEAGADVVFAPGQDEVYPGGEPQVTVEPGPLGTVLEGVSRPTHFRGVLTVVAKLFGMVRPDVAVFGEKDYQQLVLIRQMVRDLGMGVDILAGGIVREHDGLALSSRNRYLDHEQRSLAVSLSCALRAGADAAELGRDGVLAAAHAVLEPVSGRGLPRADVARPERPAHPRRGSAPRRRADRPGEADRQHTRAPRSTSLSGGLMLLCADIGNSHTVLGLLSQGKVSDHWRVATEERRTADEWAVLIRGLLAGTPTALDLEGVAVCSTVPSVLHEWRDMLRTYYAQVPHLVVEPGVRTGVPVLMDNPREVGADRIINALAASHLFDGATIVVDFGTATTFDVVSAKGEYVGGAIAPGIEISLEALGRRGAQLRKVELLRPRSVIAKNTVEALQSGMLFGFASAVDGIVTRMIEELGVPVGAVNVIATGGLAPLIREECATITDHQPWLTLLGLELAFTRNA